MNDPKMTLEQAQEAASLSAHPKVTKDSIAARIKETQYFTHGTLTLCVLTMVNGFKSVGKAAPASPENFDPAIGERYAYEDAFRSLWQLEGYLLCEKLYAAPPTPTHDGLDV